MNKATINNLFLGLSIVLVGSCKPALKVSSDYDRTVNFSEYKTFSLYYLATSKNVSELNEERLWNSIRTEMTKKGYIENDQEPDVVELHIERGEEDYGRERNGDEAQATHGLGRAPGGNLRARQRRDQHRHRHRQQAQAGLQGVQSEHDLQVDRQHEERTEQHQLLCAERGQAGAQMDDPEQR